MIPAESIRYDDTKRLIAHFGRQVLRRLHTAGARTVQIEDVIGELNIAWCEARDRFDASQGVPFVAYLKRGMIQQINRWAQKEINVYLTAPMSMDEPVECADFGMTSDINRHERVTVDTPTIEDEAVSHDQVAQILERLSPDARTYVETLANPPEFLVEEMKALQARAIYGRDRGINSAGPKRITGTMIMDAMGKSRLQRCRINKEIEQAIFAVTGEVSQ